MRLRRSKGLRISSLAIHKDVVFLCNKCHSFFWTHEVKILCYTFCVRYYLVLGLSTKKAQNESKMRFFKFYEKSTRKMFLIFLQEVAAA